MHKTMVRQWRYYGAGEDIGSFGVTKGQFLAGKIIGFIAMPDSLPKPPGDDLGEDRSQAQWEESLIQAARQLEQDGVRLISTTYGPFARFQKVVADAVDLPVYFSPLIQIPWIKVCLRKEEKILILSDDPAELEPDILEALSVDAADLDRCLVKDLSQLPLWGQALKAGDRYHFGGLAGEVADFVARTAAEEAALGAVLFGSLRFPSFASQIQQAASLPVYDAITMLKYGARGCLRRQFEGFA